MACEVCGLEAFVPTAGVATVACTQCGFPEVGEEAARALAGAADLVAAGAIDRAVRKLQQAAKASPDSYIPHLRLVAVYERKGREEAAFLRLADRAMSEALRLGPRERDVHVARLGLAAKLGRLKAVREEYLACANDDPLAKECTQMIDAMERISSAGSVVALATGSGKAKARYCFLGATAAGVVGLVELVLVVRQSLSDDDGSSGVLNFFLCVVMLTAASILGLEGVRALKGVKT